MKIQVLLVEGKGDKFVIERLRDKIARPNNYEIITKNSVEQLIESISAEISSKKDTIGILVDADENLQSRWDAIKYRLSPKFTIPSELPKEGLIITEKNKKIGVWILPNNEFKGILEDFIAFLVPKGDKLMPVVDDTLKYLESNALNLYSDINKSKTKIKKWLAWQEDPETSMGTAISKNILSTDEDICKNFVDWLTRLFN
jgi:5S rRNA maturation endonuclease (ribonuclease M5)